MSSCESYTEPNRGNDQKENHTEGVVFHLEDRKNVMEAYMLPDMTRENVLLFISP